MADTKKTWVSIVIAGVIIVVMLGVAAIGTTAFFVYRHINRQFVPPETASAEFARVRGRFVNQQPMIEIASDEVFDAGDEASPRVHAVIHRERVADGEVHALHVLAYDARVQKLVRADIPRWLLELSSAGGRLRFASSDILPGTGERITLDDFDRRGPGLIMNVRRLRGTELVVWTD